MLKLSSNKDSSATDDLILYILSCGVGQASMLYDVNEIVFYNKVQVRLSLSCLIKKKLIIFAEGFK